MLAMEAAMNLTDYAFTGGAILTWWVIPISLFVGFITPWPYNYWRLQKHGKSCHEVAFPNKVMRFSSSKVMYKK
jgi:hypothetical protein